VIEMAVKRIPCPFKKGDIVFAYAESRPTLKALVLEGIDGVEGDDRREPPRIRYRVLEVYCPWFQSHNGAIAANHRS